MPGIPPMKVTETNLSGVLLFEPEVFGDERGFFTESYNRRNFAEAAGLDPVFVQDNHSRSGRGVLRGLHYQVRQTQGKLVRVIRGSVFDVAVDLRRSSPGFGAWTGNILSAENFRQLWIPEGFAHGFLALEDDTEFFYKTTDYYAPQHERTLLWNDPALGIDWPVQGIDLSLSARDEQGLPLARAETFT